MARQKSLLNSRFLHLNTLTAKRAPPCNPNPIYSNLRQFPEPRCVNADHLTLLPANTSNGLRLNSFLWPWSPSPHSGTTEKAQRCQLAASCHVVLIKRGDFRTSNGSFCSISLSGCFPPLSSVLKSSDIHSNRTTKAMQDLALQSCGQPKVLSRPLTTHF